MKHLRGIFHVTGTHDSPVHDFDGVQVTQGTGDFSSVEPRSVFRKRPFSL